MNKLAKFENLSIEIFLEILDYFHAIDIIIAFSSLNSRISSIINSIHLNILITSKHHHWHIKQLSNYLINHANQVISFSINDDSQDHSSTINLLFQRHRFDNLRSCILKISSSFSKLPNIIEQLEKLTNLQSLYINQPQLLLSQFNKYDSTDSILTRIQSTTLRSVDLLYNYDHYRIFNGNNRITLNITNLSLILHNSSNNNQSIYSLIDILRFCPLLRYLRLIIRNELLLKRNNIFTSSSWINDVDNIPILTNLLYFDFYTIEIEDISFLENIFKCMPHLIQFTITFTLLKKTLNNIINVIDGQFWKQFLLRHVEHLRKFDLFISVIYFERELIDLDNIIDSFKYFVTHYNDWQMIVSRWICCMFSHRQQVHLRTLNYPNKLGYTDFNDTDIICGTFEMRSTIKILDFDYNFFSNNRYTSVIMSTYANSSDMLTISTLPFRHIICLTIQFENRMLTWFFNKFMKLLFNGVWIEQRGYYNPEKYVINLSHLIDLSTITELRFQRLNNLIFIDTVKLLLLSCPNLSYLTISASFLFSKRFFNISSLISVFNRLSSLDLSTDGGDYFIIKYAPKLFQYFPSLIKLIINVYSFDNCVQIINILLTGLSKLVYIKVNFHRDTLLNDPFTSDYIIKKRRQAFGFNKNKKDCVSVTNDGKSLIIWLE